MRPTLYYKKSHVYSAKICLLALFFQLLTMLWNVFSFSLHSFPFSFSFCVFCGMVICLCDSGIRWGALTQEWTKLFLAATHLLLFKVCVKGRVRETLMTLPPHISHVLLCPLCLSVCLRLTTPVLLCSHCSPVHTALVHPVYRVTYYCCWCLWVTLSLFHSPSSQWWPAAHFQSWRQQQGVNWWFWGPRSRSYIFPLPQPLLFFAHGNRPRHGVGRFSCWQNLISCRRRHESLTLLEPRLFLLFRWIAAQPALDRRVKNWVMLPKSNHKRRRRRRWNLTCQPKHPFRFLSFILSLPLSHSTDAKNTQE